MNVLAIQNCALEGFGWYESHLRERGATWRRLDGCTDPAYPDPRECDMALIGGTPDAAYDEASHPYLTTELAFLDRAIAAGTPCFGICCGAQLLARALGADVRPAERKEIGCYEVTRTAPGRRDPLLETFPDAFPVFQWHGDTFDVPPGADLLVTGDVCANQMFRKGPIVGVQFHVEIPADEAGRWAEAYAGELAAFGKERRALVDECRRSEAEMRRWGVELLDRYIDVCVAGATTRRPT